MLLNQCRSFACRGRGYRHCQTDGVKREAASKCTCFLQYGTPRWVPAAIFRNCKVVSDVRFWSRCGCRVAFQSLAGRRRTWREGNYVLRKTFSYLSRLYTDITEPLCDVQSWQSVDVLPPNSKTSGQNRVYTSNLCDFIVLCHWNAHIGAMEHVPQGCACRNAPVVKNNFCLFAPLFKRLGSNMSTLWVTL